MEKYGHERQSINEWLNRPKYRVWKYSAIGIACVIFLLLMSTVIWMDSLQWRSVMILRGCAGALAILLFVICAIYYYIAYNDYIRHRFNPRNNK